MAELLFVGLLSVSLLVAGLPMLWQPRRQRETPAAPRGRWLEPVAGGTLGFLAGVVGIGGGIFLAPLLYMLRWGSERAIAGTAAVFILVNSIAGLAVQLSKGNGVDGGCWKRRRAKTWIRLQAQQDHLSAAPLTPRWR